MPFAWTTNASERGDRLREGLNATAKIILFGLVMDTIYQVIVFKAGSSNTACALYRRLRSIEERLHKGLYAVQTAALEEEIEFLEHDMIKLALPVRHSHLYFSVKSHLNLVRIRIRSRLESSSRWKSETKV